MAAYGGACVFVFILGILLFTAHIWWGGISFTAATAYFAWRGLGVINRDRSRQQARVTKAADPPQEHPPASGPHQGR